MPKREGPISTEMEWIPGDPSDHKGDSGDCFDGVKGYPAGSGGKAPELTFVEDGVWGKVPKDNRPKE